MRAVGEGDGMTADLKTNRRCGGLCHKQGAGKEGGWQGGRESMRKSLLTSELNSLSSNKI